MLDTILFYFKYSIVKLHKIIIEQSDKSEFCLYILRKMAKLPIVKNMTILDFVIFFLYYIE